MSTADHPETDGQTKRVNRVLEDILRSYATSFVDSWSSHLPMAEFAINNSVHVSTGHTPFYLNSLRHPRVPAILSGVNTYSSGGGTHANAVSSDVSHIDHSLILGSLVEAQAEVVSNDVEHIDNSFALGNAGIKYLLNKDTLGKIPKAHSEIIASVNVTTSDKIKEQVDKMLLERQAIVRFVRDNIAESVDKQKEQSDKRGRKNKNIFIKGDLVLLSTSNLRSTAISNLGSSKLLPRYIGPFKVIKRIGDAYILDIPSRMKLHPTFYVGRLKKYSSSQNQHRDVSRSSQLDSELLSSSEQPSVHTDVLDYQESSDNLGEPSDGSQLVPLESQFDSEEYSLHQPLQQKDNGLRPLRPYRTKCQNTYRVTSSRGYSTYPNTQGRDRKDSCEDLPFLSRNAFSQPPPVVDSKGDTLYIVQRLVCHKDARAAGSYPHRLQRTYRVRWLGYSPEEDSWLPRTQLIEDIPDLVSEYEQEIPFRN